jgi:hypothetical protein
MLVRIAVAVVVALGAGCSTPCEIDDDCPDLYGCVAGSCQQECVSDKECHVGEQCSRRGQCIELATGSIRWVSPEPGSTVDEVFDAVVHVSFRSADAAIRVYRGGAELGDACAPVPPYEIAVAGDPDETFEQDVELPGLRAAGDPFTLVAALEASGGFTSDQIELSAPDVREERGGFTIDEPLEAELEGDPTFVVLRGAVTEAAVESLTIVTQPVEGAPTPALLLDPALRTLEGVVAPVARGRQAIVLSLTNADGAVKECARGVTVPRGPPGIELALWYDTGDELVEGRLDQRILVEGAATVVCSSETAGEDGDDATAACALVKRTPPPAARGEEVLVVTGVTDGFLSVAVVPGAVSAPVMAGVRVSVEGSHHAFLGPFALDPGLGQAWIAGDLIISAGAVSVTPRFDLSFGAPW